MVLGWRLLRRKPVLSKLIRLQSTVAIASSVASLGSILRSSAHDKTLLEGLCAHHRITFLGLEQTQLLANLLLHMYGSCGHLQEAVFLFAHLPQRDSFSWNFILTAYAKCGYFHNALQLFVFMLHDGVMPDKFIFASILSACADEADLTSGMHIHFLMMWEGLQLDVTLHNATLNLYAKCGCLDDARATFLEMNQKNEASYNSIVSGYASCGQNRDAITLFSQMMMEGIMPDKVSFIAAVSACMDDLHKESQYIHARLVVGEYKTNIVLTNSLINRYGKRGDLSGALNIFDGLRYRSVVSWNALITSHAQYGQGRKAYELFERLHQEGQLPNSVTFCSLSPGFESLALRECKQLHIRVIHNGFDVNEDATSSLINMYIKCGSFADALQVFDRMPRHDLRAWNSLGVGLFEMSLGKPTLWQFYQMVQEGVLPDKVTLLNVISGCATDMALTEGIRLHALLASSKTPFDIVISSALLNMYAKCGSLQNALAVFSTMPERNEYSWAAMITAYAMQGEARNSLLMFEQMQWEGINPDKVSVLCLLCACANQSGLHFCKSVHTFVLETGFDSDATIKNSLLTMYSKCGSFGGANKIFDKMLERDLVSWTAAIAACAQHGQGKEAFSCFEQMQNNGLLPDKVTFVEILSACSRAGLIDEACYILASMEHKHGIQPTVDHFNCVIDLLSKAGRLDVAEHLILNMPTRATAASWLTLLGACRSQLDVERGEHAAKWACHLSLQDASPYVTLSNLYAGSGRFDDAAYIMHDMWLGGQEEHHVAHIPESQL